MSLYERILEERKEEERRTGRPLGPYRGVDSPVFDRLVGRAFSKPPGYQGEILRLYQFVHRVLEEWLEGCGMAASELGTRRNIGS